MHVFLLLSMLSLEHKYATWLGKISEYISTDLDICVDFPPIEQCLCFSVNFLKRRQYVYTFLCVRIVIIRNVGFYTNILVFFIIKSLKTINNIFYFKDEICSLSHSTTPFHNSILYFSTCRY